MTLRRRLRAVWTGRQSRRVLLLSALGFLFLLSYPVASVLVSVYESRWNSFSEQATSRALDDAALAFGSIQRSARRAAAELAQDRVVRETLSDSRGSFRGLFSAARRTSEDGNAGIEIYDRQGNLVAWEGPGGTAHRRDVRLALEGQMSSFVERTPVASRLFVTLPVREQGRIVGAVLYRTTVEYHSPLSGTILHQEGLSDQLGAELGRAVRFDFSLHRPGRVPAGYHAAPLYGIDSTLIGTVLAAPPDRTSTLAGVRAKVSAGRVFVLLLLVTFGLSLLRGRFGPGVSPPAAVLVVTLAVWTGRYLLLWHDVPSAFLRSGVFDPAVFASPFGGGIARSIGETSLTVLALLVTVWYAAKRLLPQLAGWVSRGGAGGRIWGWGAALAAAAFLFALFRGTAAVIRSAVFDSTLPFGDMSSLFPSSDLTVMMINMIILSLGMVIVAGFVTFAVVGFLTRRHGGKSAWRWTVLLFLVAPFLAGMAEEEPLAGLPARLLFAATALTAAAMIRRRPGPDPPWPGRGQLLAVFALSALLLVPLLNQMVAARERRWVETYATEVLRPVDTWLTYVVRETLDGFRSANATQTLRAGDAENVEQLAFSVWARSVACREGYAAVLAIRDAEHQEISRFAIGGQSAAAAGVDAELRLSDTTGYVVRQVGQGVNAVRVYGGAMPVADTAGTVLAYARVIVTAGQQSLFRGETPVFLRAPGRESVDAFTRRIVLSEFRDGALFSSSSDLFPVGHVLQAPVLRVFEDPRVTSLWREDVIDERAYTSLYIHKGNGTVVALSVPDLGPVRLLVGVEKMLGYCSLTLALAGVLWLGLRAARRQRLVFGFRDRLLAALLLTAVVPLVLISLYGQVDAGERLMQETARLLDDQTGAVSASLMTAPGGGVEALLAVTPPVVEAIASDLELDFNVYVDSLLLITSRPDLYALGVIERRLPGSVYAAMLLGGRRFHVETHRIGNTRYAAGYRLLLDQAGRVVGTLSVPTLYRQGEIEDEVVRRNAFLLGVYLVVLGSLVVLAILLANRIAAPIHRLTDATRRVARGDFDVSVRTPGSPPAGGGDEIDQLVSSFEAMTSDLKKNREELVRYERELAWKEMAKQVAHEIKNPLTPIRLAIQHLRQTYRDRVSDFDDVLERVTRTVIEQIDTLSRIASEFSHFARMPRRRIERTGLNAIVQESAHLCAQEGGTKFDVRLDPSQPEVDADREELRRAFINVFKNGMQAMGGAGTIHVVTSSTENEVAVLVRDGGPGIPDEVRARLFEPNFSTKTEGMGLGLAIVKKTVDDMHGTITIESGEGTGTTVRLAFPRPAEGT